MKNLIEKITRKNLLILEQKKLGELKQEIVINFEIYKGGHGGQSKHVDLRQQRHGKEFLISDSEIFSLLSDAKKYILENIVTGYIVDKSAFVVTRYGNDEMDYLNAAVKPELIDTNTWNLVVLTVRRGSDFRMGRNQLQILVEPKESINSEDEEDEEENLD